MKEDVGLIKLFRRARELERNNELNEAKDCYQELLDLNPTLIQACIALYNIERKIEQEQKIQYYLCTANKAYELKKYSEAAKYYEKALDLAPTSHTALAEFDSFQKNLLSFNKRSDLYEQYKKLDSNITEGYNSNSDILISIFQGINLSSLSSVILYFCESEVRSLIDSYLWIKIVYCLFIGSYVALVVLYFGSTYYKSFKYQDIRKQVHQRIDNIQNCKENFEPKDERKKYDDIESKVPYYDLTKLFFIFKILNKASFIVLILAFMLHLWIK